MSYISDTIAMKYDTPKTRMMSFRLTRDEDSALRDVAKKQGVKVSSLIQAAIRRLIRRAA